MMGNAFVDIKVLLSAKEIKDAALQLGFAAVGMAEVTVLDDELVYLQQYLADGRHSCLSYMERNQEKRANPELLLEGARSVVAVLLNYRDLEIQQRPDTYKIASYAWLDDYHDVMKPMLEALASKIKTFDADITTKTFVDSSAVFEKRWAQKAGLGWLGNNSLLIHPEFGSFCFVGIILTNAIFDKYDQELDSQCGNCQNCMDACPNDALIDKRKIDTARCISCQTIENKSEQRPLLNYADYVYGCDICQDVCPWNRKRHPLPSCFQALPEVLSYSKTDWQQLSEADFQRLFAKSPIKRIGYQRWQRNLDGQNQ